MSWWSRTGKRLGGWLREIRSNRLAAGASELEEAHRVQAARSYLTQAIKHNLSDMASEVTKTAQRLNSEAQTKFEPLVKQLLEPNSPYKGLNDFQGFTHDLDQVSKLAIEAETAAYRARAYTSQCLIEAKYIAIRNPGTIDRELIKAIEHAADLAYENFTAARAAREAVQNVAMNLSKVSGSNLARAELVADMVDKVNKASATAKVAEAAAKLVGGLAAVAIVATPNEAHAATAVSKTISSTIGEVAWSVAEVTLTGLEKIDQASIAVIDTVGTVATFGQVPDAGTQTAAAEDKYVYQPGFKSMEKNLIKPLGDFVVNPLVKAVGNVASWAQVKTKGSIDLVSNEVGIKTINEGLELDKIATGKLDASKTIPDQKPRGYDKNARIWASAERLSKVELNFTPMDDNNFSESIAVTDPPTASTQSITPAL